MADYTSGAIYFTGLGSGTDFDSIIEATVEAESVRLTQLEEWEEYWQEKSDVLDELNTELVSLRSTLEGMDSISEFSVKTASSSDSTSVSVSADGDAVDGTHTIIVNQLAANDIWSHTGDGESSSSNSITDVAATFTYSYAGEQYTIDVPAGTTLSGFADLINSNPDSKADVRATLINDGDEYHLQLYGMDMGADNTVTIDASTIDGYAPEDFTNTQAAQSAQIKVDGYPPEADAWIERDTNTVDDVIDGVTLKLKEVTDEAKITVSTDTDAIKEEIVEFVEEVNSIRLLLQELTAVDEDGNGSTMTGNYGVDIVKQTLQTITASKGLGFSYYDSDTGLGDYYTSLSQLGITTDADQSSETYGQLIIDEEDLNEALANDPDGVVALFATAEEGESQSSDMTYVSSVDGITTPGDHDVTYEVVGGEIVSATIDGEDAMVSGSTITGQYGTDGGGLTVRADNLADGSYSGVVSVKQGKIGQMADALADLTDSEDGILVIIEENYDEIIANTQESIEQEEDRLSTLEDRLRERYAALEEVLTEYSSINDSLETQLESLGSYS